MSKIVTVTGSGQITIPAEFRQRLGIKTGDRLMVSESATGEIVVNRRLLSVDEMAGSVRTPQGLVVDDDYGNVIREAMDERADQIMARLKDVPL